MISPYVCAVFTAAAVTEPSPQALCIFLLLTAAASFLPKNGLFPLAALPVRLALLLLRGGDPVYALLAAFSAALVLMCGKKTVYALPLLLVFGSACALFSVSSVNPFISGDLALLAMLPDAGYHMPRKNRLKAVFFASLAALPLCFCGINVCAAIITLTAAAPVLIPFPPAYDYSGRNDRCRPKKHSYPTAENRSST